MSKHIIIAGGGLSGLLLAHYLSEKNVAVTILEASPRLGGRVQPAKGVLGTPLELGATWFSDQHPALLGLLEELKLSKYPQYSGGRSLFQTKSFEPTQEFYVPESEQPSYRIAGGTQVLVDTLEARLSHQKIHLNSTVTKITLLEEGVRVQTNQNVSYHADQVILCLPPELASGITFSPSLPSELKELLPTVQTWMAGAIKFVVEYKEPFWRNKGYSGMLYSHAGLIVEMYDHTNITTDRFGFTGFLNGGAGRYSKDVRKELVLKQLVSLFGSEAQDASDYQDKIWTDRFITAGSQVINYPHQNNGHPALQQGYMNNKLHFCGTETSSSHPGYMEGAVVAAKDKALQVMRILKGEVN